MNSEFSHFRFYVCTRMKLEVSAKDAYEELQSAWTEQAHSISAVKKWRAEFASERRSSFEDASRSGRPSTVRTPVLVKRVQEAVEADAKLSTRDLADQLMVDHMTIHRIFTEDLFLRNVCSV